MTTAQNKINKVVDSGICSGCGACVALDKSNISKMVDTKYGPIPDISEKSNLPDFIDQVCPSFGINYPELYKDQYNCYPDNWLIGHVHKTRVGYSGNQEIRRRGASGGVLTQTLIYLLETKYIDGVILAKQGLPTAEKARCVIAETREEIIDCAQSVYIPVSMLDILNKLDENKSYAITCLPEQSAALRKMQVLGFKPANQIKFILGPYTGTALYPAAINCFLRSKRINKKVVGSS